MRLSAPVFRLKRRARLLAREKDIRLHEALDCVAREEGFRSWSHLSISVSEHRPASEILSQLSPGDLMLLGARPGHGKTLLAMGLVAEAVRSGRQGFFFALDYHEGDVMRCLASLGLDRGAMGSRFVLETSQDICAGPIIETLAQAGPNTVAVIDYLQILDQKRSNPEIGDQMRALKAFARSSGAIIVALSQIERAFELQGRPLPELSDVHLPNPLDLKVFTKACFLHAGEVRLDAVA